MRKVSSRGDAGRGERALMVAAWWGTGGMGEVESFGKADAEDEFDVSDTLCDGCFPEWGTPGPRTKFSLLDRDLEEPEPEAGWTFVSRVRGEVCMTRASRSCKDMSNWEGSMADG
jgi:hypothetical protein